MAEDNLHTYYFVFILNIQRFEIDKSKQVGQSTLITGCKQRFQVN